jgi:hypothetical protein
MEGSQDKKDNFESSGNIFLFSFDVFQLVLFLTLFTLILHKLKWQLSSVFFSFVLLAYFVQFIARFTLDLSKIVK